MQMQMIFVGYDLKMPRRYPQNLQIFHCKMLIDFYRNYSTAT